VPELPTFTSLLSLWPTWLSHAVSYTFIAIVPEVAGERRP